MIWENITQAGPFYLDLCEEKKALTTSCSRGLSFVLSKRNNNFMLGKYEKLESIIYNNGFFLM